MKIRGRWTGTPNPRDYPYGVIVDIWYENSKVDCPCGDVKFKQQVKTGGLTTMMQWRFQQRGDDQWHGDRGQVGGWYPEEQGGASIFPEEGFFPPGIHDEPGGYDNMMMDFETYAYCVEKGKPDKELCPGRKGELP